MSQLFVDSPSRCLHLQFAKVVQLERQQEQSELAQKLYQLNRAIVYNLGAYLCNLDLKYDRANDLDEQNQNAIKNATTNLQKRGHFNYSNWKRSFKYNWLSKALFYLVLAATAYLQLVLYFQYSYDFNLLRVNRLMKRTNGSLLTHDNSYKIGAASAKSLDLLQKLNVTEKYARTFNPNYWHLTMFVESVYISDIMLMATMYLTYYLEYTYFTPFDYHFYRELLDSEQECESSKRLVKRQVIKFKTSSRDYVSASTSSINMLSANSRMAMDSISTRNFGLQRRLAPPPSSDAKKTIDELASRQSETDELLEEMLESGSLTPMNRSNKWVEMRLLIELAYHIWIFIYALFLNLTIMIGLVSQSRGSVQLHSPTMLAFLFLIILNLPMIVICVPASTIACLDQIRYVTKLRKLIMRCIELNRSELFVVEQQSASGTMWRNVPTVPQPIHTSWRNKTFPSSRSTQTATGSLAQVDKYLHETQQLVGSVRIGEDAFAETRRRMNANYLFVLMHYKIFVAQFEPLKRSVGLVCLQAFVIIFEIPIIARLHLPYAMQANYNERSISLERLKAISLLLSCSMLFPAIFAILPVCYLYSRCQDLYRALWSLMAHLTNVRRVQQAGVAVYDRHAVMLLDKELAHPDRLLRRFMTRSVAGLSGSYTSLVRSLFWWGIVVLSIVLFDESSIELDSVSTILTDPLGVY